jgi:hypothetical protein
MTQPVLADPEFSPVALFAPMPLPTQRFRTRHVQQTLADFLHQHLVEFGWGDSRLPANDPRNTGRNFAADPKSLPVTYEVIVPDDNSVTVAPNTVSVTLGDAAADDPFEMGASFGGLYHLALPFFVDVYGARQSLARSICDDVKVILGKVPTFPIFDYRTTPPTQTPEYVEVEDLEGPVRPPQQTSSALADFRRTWLVMQGVAHVYFTADRDGS